MKDYVNELKHIKDSYCVRLTRSHIIYIQVDVSSLLFFSAVYHCSMSHRCSEICH